MSMEVEVIAHSQSAVSGIDITTLRLRYWRGIHADLMTHRAFSRSASGSRAIPTATMLASIRNKPAMPSRWGKNQKGMQDAGDHAALIHLPPPMTLGAGAATPEQAWAVAAKNACDVSEAFAEAGYHKQVANRLTEPFQWINVLVTSTDWNNWDTLRNHKDADPSIQVLAQMMKAARAGSTPRILSPGEWHMPYIREDDYKLAQQHCRFGRITRDEPSHDEIIKLLLKVSVARSARMSYYTHGTIVFDLAKDLELHEQLMVSDPLHASPAEHQATPDTISVYKVERFEPNEATGAEWVMTLHGHDWDNKHLHGNFRGWVQNRKLYPNEYVPN